jgi:hypothetical protein
VQSGRFQSYIWVSRRAFHLPEGEFEDIAHRISSCNDEERICQGSPALDSMFQSMAADWHSGCDGHGSFTPTTPSLSTIPASLSRPVLGCPDVQSACNIWGALQTSCSLSYYTSLAQLSSCNCVPQMLSLNYACEFVGNASCLHTSAALTNLVLSGFCTNFDAVLGTAGPPNVSATPTTIVLTQATATPSATPIGASSPLLLSATPTATKSSSGSNLMLSLFQLALSLFFSGCVALAVELA